MFVAAYQTRAQCHDTDDVSKKCGFICLIHIQRVLLRSASCIHPFRRKDHPQIEIGEICEKISPLDREKFYHNFTRRTSSAFTRVNLFILF